ncbi:phage tail sheath family protein [Dethiothermospora halolimnae]|uniref:phage tail sheath family protein n=1 Tax=Dethiothermospora halolimnae TaxID=3114390 RepID=UPI003CCC1F63
MPGGTFNPLVGKVRPGMYMNFEAVTQDRIKSQERGTVLMPLPNAKWGPAKEFITITDPSETYDLLGYDINDKEMLLIKEAFKNCKKVIAYVLAEGEKAKARVGDLEITAKHGGVRGNDIKIVIAKDSNDSKNVITYLGDNIVDEQNVNGISDLKDNRFVEFTKGEVLPAKNSVEKTLMAPAEELVETAGTSLKGGSNGVYSNIDITEFLSESETQFFDCIAFPIEDPSYQSSFKTKLEYFRDEIGKKVMGVTSNYDGDLEGLINVVNGVVLNDGTKLSAREAVAWVAGATSGANINESLTHKVYQDAVDVNPRLKHDQIVEGLQKGYFIFTNTGDKVIVEQDRNSLTTLSAKKTKKWTKNRPLRVMDAINNDLLKSFNGTYAGKLDNNDDGHSIAKALITKYLTALQDVNAIRNLNKENDVIIDKELSVGDELYADIAVQPMDAAEKFYFTVKVR